MPSSVETVEYETVPHNLELVGDINPDPNFSEEDFIDERFEVVSELAKTGLSYVYLTRDMHNDGDDVVVKLHTNRSVGSIIRSERERLLASEIIHPKLIPVVTTGLHIHEDGTNNPYIATSFAAEGDLLHKEVESEDDLPVVIGSMLDATEALAELHRRDLVHRDIKPANILRDKSGGFLSDLGTVAIYKELDETEPLPEYLLVAKRVGDLATTGSKQVVGSIAYMTPQRLRGAPATPEDDFFALGVSAYEEFNGKRPWETSKTSILETLWNASNAQISVRDFPDFVPERAREVVVALLDKNPVDRANLDDFAELRDLID